ncbi:HEAT repeat domain-containing protein [Pseudoalteromonas sp. S16_S37]|uniref:HEAT repeat domain-containing protein n=1 Tax=Pseudoalteromonas sp. S16_S37 TaxID=2720228 RepID=UPI001681BDDA|nr:HEAT repeat domain-containing protein [Pseudoalteromonas sp. S16_S37]MBD1581912.1 HEAT repeat domain-containing protein [Pseudoalteromonas sp. S16_S37]
MKIKVYSMVLLVIATLFVVGYVASPSSPSNAANQAAGNIDISEGEQQKTQNQFTYIVQIDSSIRSDKQVVLTHSQLSWHMQLQTQTGSNTLLGQLSNINYTQDNKPVSLVSDLPFKVDYQQHRFEQLDLLGLPKEHTLQVIKQLFDLISYDLTQPLVIDEAQRQATYRYQQADNRIVRSTVELKYHNANHKPEKEQQDWQLLLTPSGELEKLSYVNSLYWQQQQQNYIVEQSVNVVKIANKYAALTTPNSDANAHIKGEQLQTVQREITDKAAFEAALVELKESLSVEQAKAVGQYLVDNYSAYEIQALLNDMPNFSSAIIYSLQKLQTPQAEAMLVDLIQFEQTSDLDKHKLAMALGRFGASSALSLQTLQAIAAQPEHQVANTALLSLGTMAYFTPEQAVNVKNYLQHNISEQFNLSTTVLAVENSKDPSLLAKLPPLLGSDDDSAKLNSIKVLSKHADYQDQVVSALLSSPQPKFVAAFTRTMLEAGHTLSAPNIARLKQLQNQTQNPVVRKKIAELLEGKAG